MTSSCDHQLRNPPAQVLRNAARFEWTSPNQNSPSEVTKLLINYIAMSWASQWTNSKIDRDGLTYHWALSRKDKEGCSIRIQVAHENDATWRIVLTRNDQATTGTAARLDDLLPQHPDIASLRWFNLEQLSQFGTKSYAHPY